MGFRGCRGGGRGSGSGRPAEGLADGFVHPPRRCLSNQKFFFIDNYESEEGSVINSRRWPQASTGHCTLVSGRRRRNDEEEERTGGGGQDKVVEDRKSQEHTRNEKCKEGVNKEGAGGRSKWPKNN